MLLLNTDRKLYMGIYICHKILPLVTLKKHKSMSLKFKAIVCQNGVELGRMLNT